MTDHFEEVDAAARLSKFIFSEIQAHSQASDAHLQSLHVLFGKHLAKAVHIVDRGGVFCFTGQDSQRSVYHVQGQSGGEPYLVFPRSYCSCHSFYFDVVTKGEVLYCKHLIAVEFASSLGRARSTTVSDQVIAELLSSY